MPEAESDGAPETEPGIKTWVTIIGSVTALLVAITGLIRTCETPGKAEAATAATSTPLVIPTTPPKTRTLLWVPADCRNGAPAGIALDSCAEQRTLDWLGLQIDELRREQKLGFEALPRGFALKSSDTADGANYRLTVDSNDGQELFAVGVGYNVTNNRKDGGLHVTKRGQMVAQAWLGADGAWYDKP